ncbi:MAG: DUF2267 domain-containing protein [Candidatus Humimicrobiaceae bacterium]
MNIFQNTIQKSNEWIKDLNREFSWDDYHKTYIALKATIIELRERLTLKETADFGSQLPMLIRGLFFEGWSPKREPKKYNKEEFLKNIHSYFQDDPDIDPEKIAKTVFQFFSSKISAGEIKDIKSILPEDMEKLW